MTIKRRPDFRKIRDTTTYTISELAIVTARTQSTVYEWLKDGLPTIDDCKPTLIYGWQVRKWLGDWWEARLHRAPLGQIFCFGCQEVRQPKIDNVIFEKQSSGAIRVKGPCSVCGHTMFRSIASSDLVAFQEALHALMNEMNGFGESNSSTGSPTNPADFETLAVDEKNGPPKLGKARTLALPGNPINERIKRQYFEHLLEAQGYSPKSIRKYEIAILRFESFFKYRNFGILTKDEAIAFKHHIRKCDHNPPSKIATLSACQALLKFLRNRPGASNKIALETLEYLNLTKKERRAATPVEKIIVPPTPAEVDQVIRSMPHSTLREKRDRAIFTLLATTGIRASALVSLRIKHIDFELGGVRQPGSEVDTKFGKSQVALFVAFYDEWVNILKAYVDDLKAYGFENEDPLFPVSALVSGKGVRYGERVLIKEFMGSAQLITSIVPKAFIKAGLRRETSHVFRHMMNKVAYEDGSTLRFAKSISNNLGHSNIKVTNASYGKLTLGERQAAFADYIARKNKTDNVDEEIDILVVEIAKKRGLF